SRGPVKLRGRVAEWCLALILPAYRAKAIVGDLLESDPNVFSFWLAIAQVASSALFDDLWSWRWHWIRLWVCTFLGSVALTGLAAICIISLWENSAFATHPYGPSSFGVPDWGYRVLQIVLGIVCSQLLSGWVISRLRRGRELTAAFALNLLSS